MNNVRTVSDTKRTFYSLHTRPINTIYRRVVEELMVEMHLLSVNADFQYNPIYALGVVTTFERFMQGYKPDEDKESIYNSLIKSIEEDPQKYRQDASMLEDIAKSLPAKDLVTDLSQQRLGNNSELQALLENIANNPKFKYSRLFAIGLYTLLESSDPEMVKDEKLRNEALKNIANGLHLSDDKLSKDLDLYRSNLDKMAQAAVVMADMIAAERKRREQRAQQSSATVAPPNKE
ncbi:photosystem II biogenesis protein Psp29 [Rivularia sp. UHCC 0363]|uniref:photosystem II biogenesis protein Psp29 n=1 Tax=Rivularia sp. UHCC 0363 TaxID=3110244 RepID=UPI002B1F8304|nr:photosystem II biogenesis protein Psp29 [Rivularia sp. UHCC 0363]MEA5596540.1 photosystem II biogenesis protein Psp29 [Rivularia sp. UHCC 0363]